MALAINIFLHLLLVGTLLLFVWAAFQSALAEPDKRERAIRFMAMATGGLIALGANQAGLGYADFTVQALAGARAPSAGAAIVSAVIPGLMGIGLGFLIVRTFNKSDRIGQRLVGFLAVLASVAFALVYAQAVQAQGVILGVAALPNLSFVVGVMLTIVFGWDPDKQGGAGVWDTLRGLADSRSSSRGNSDANAVRIVKKDEFDSLN